MVNLYLCLSLQKEAGFALIQRKVKQPLDFINEVILLMLSVAFRCLSMLLFTLLRLLYAFRGFCMFSYAFEAFASN